MTGAVLRALPKPDFGLAALIALLMAVVSGAAIYAGLGDVALLAGLVALYLAMSTFDGTLRGDLTLLALLAVSAVVFALLPVLLASRAPALGAVGVLAGVFVAAVVPRFWQRSLLFGRALGFIVVYVYGFQHLDTSTPAEIGAGVLVALVGVAVLRLVAGLADPAGATRRQLARLLVDPDPEAANRGIFTWLTESPAAWLGTVIRGAVLVRSALGPLRAIHQDADPADPTPGSDFVAKAEAAAELVASNVRARRPNRDRDRVEMHLAELRGLVPGLPPSEQARGERVLEGLALANEAATHRDSTRLTDVGPVDRRFLRATLRGGLTRHSEWFRHGARTVCLMAMILIFVWVQSPGPFVLALLTGTYGVLYPSWTGSVRQVWRNVTGMIAGAALSALIFGLLPRTWIVLTCCVILFVGLTYIANNLTIFYACLVVTLSGVVAPAVDLSAGSYAFHYVGYTAAGALIGTLVAFMLVPTLSMGARWARISRAQGATSAVLAALADTPRKDPATYLPAFRKAFAAQQDAMPVQSAASRVAVLAPVAEAATALETLNLLCLGLLFETSVPPDPVIGQLRAAATALAGDGRSDAGTADDALLSGADDPFIDLVIVEAARVLDAVRTSHPGEVGRPPDQMS